MDKAVDQAGDAMTELALKSSLPEGCISDLTFDAWLAEDLEPMAVVKARAHLTVCERCRARHAELSAEYGAFLQELPDLASLATTKAAQTPRLTGRSKHWWVGTSLLAAAAALLLMVRPAEEELSTRSKGGPSLGFFRKRGDQVVAGTRGDCVRAADQLRFTYSSEKPVYLAVLNLDGRGEVSVYYPASEQAAPLPRASRAPLPSAVELDDARGEEHIFALFCAKSFAIEPLKKELARSHKLVAPEGCQLDHLTLCKE